MGHSYSVSCNWGMSVIRPIHLFARYYTGHRIKKMRAFNQMNLFIVLALFVNCIYGCSTYKSSLRKLGMEGLGIGEYLKHRGVWCRPGQNMNATNVNDAKLECTANPECRMFDDK